MIVDTDIHPGVDRERILGFLLEPWRSRLASGNAGPGGLGYWNPDGDTPDFSMRMLPDSLMDAVMWGTASRLYKLPVPEHG